MGNIAITKKNRSKNEKKIGLKKYSIYMTLINDDIFLIKTKGARGASSNINILHLA